MRHQKALFTPSVRKNCARKGGHPRQGLARCVTERLSLYPKSRATQTQLKSDQNVQLLAVILFYFSSVEVTPSLRKEGREETFSMPTQRLHGGDLPTEMQELMERPPAPGKCKGRSYLTHCRLMAQWRTAGCRGREMLLQRLWKKCVTFLSRNRDTEMPQQVVRA